ncbi:3-dehydroquinate synthase [Asticcacaulis sp. AC402]|uniref:3-dehydroquinate synthase n=1 Tax=Asticcacaulis sp. AC402 TaxID=1282361 RepID=UPI0003C3B896|nr:3-dehydroquinate synthase [Asticcacaulis sp. AC402]ESQ74030.1 3-dehydroquinate synthase [Asticcacaulis sp. AC402]
MITRIPVEGVGFKAYEVLVGKDLLKDAAGYISPFLKIRRVFIVTDANVAPLHLAPLEAQLTAAGITAQHLIVEAGEQTKSWEGLKTVTDAFVSAGLDRKDIVLALGGGVVGDLTGFACAVYMRGIDFIQIPTTVLAQVDSSVGGKTAIDHPQGKNLIGAFHQPRLVLCDLDVLTTLPAREVRCGYAEIIKYGLLGDRDFFDWLEANDAGVLALEPEAIRHAVARSVEMKAQIVAQDAREGGARALLNLGHTFGHALEAEVGFGDLLLHGEAVAVGMAQAFRYSAATGACAAGDANRAIAAIRHAGLPTAMSDIYWKDGRNSPFDPERLLVHMGHDKKAEGGTLTFVLVEGIGKAFVAKKVNRQSIHDFLVRDGAHFQEA